MHLSAPLAIWRSRNSQWDRTSRYQRWRTYDHILGVPQLMNVRSTLTEGERGNRNSWWIEDTSVLVEGLIFDTKAVLPSLTFQRSIALRSGFVHGVSVEVLKENGVVIDVWCFQAKGIFWLILRMHLGFFQSTLIPGTRAYKNVQINWCSSPSWKAAPKNRNNSKHGTSLPRNWQRITGNNSCLGSSMATAKPQEQDNLHDRMKWTMKRP